MTHHETIAHLATRMPPHLAASLTRATAARLGRRRIWTSRNRERAANVLHEARMADMNAESSALCRLARRFRVGPIDTSEVVSDEGMAHFGIWREVPNPHWPDLKSHGAWVSVVQMGKAYWVEADLYLPDQRRTAIGLRGYAKTLDRAEYMAKRWTVVLLAGLAAWQEGVET